MSAVIERASGDSESSAAAPSALRFAGIAYGRVGCDVDLRGERDEGERDDEPPQDCRGKALTEFEKARQHFLYAKGHKLGDDCCAAPVQV
jgi:hypothetical protein